MTGNPSNVRGVGSNPSAKLTPEQMAIRSGIRNYDSKPFHKGPPFGREHRDFNYRDQRDYRSQRDFRDSRYQSNFRDGRGGFRNDSRMKGHQNIQGAPQGAMQGLHHTQPISHPGPQDVSNKNLNTQDQPHLGQMSQLSGNICAFNLNQIIPLKNKYNKETSLFISHIPDTVSNEHIRTILEQIGVVKSWNRLKDMSTDKWKQSGFVVYKESAGACRALRLLRKVTLCGKTLLVTCDDKTKERLQRYKEQKLKDFSRMRHWRQGDKITEKDVDDFFEMQQDEDQGIEEMINELVAKINRSQDVIPQSTQLAVESSVDRFLMGGSKEETEEKKSMLSHEIRRFRQMEKDRNEGVVQREKQRQIEREKHRKHILNMAQEKQNNRVQEEKLREERMKRYKIRHLSNLLKKEKTREDTLKRKRESGDDGMSMPEKKRLMNIEKKWYYGEVALPNIERTIFEVGEAKERDTTLPSPQIKLDAIEMKETVYNAKPVQDISVANEEVFSMPAVQDVIEEENEELKPLAKAKEIPMDREILFNMMPNWEIVEEYKIIDRLKTFVAQTVIDLLGHAEDTLIAFVVGLLELRYDANSIKSEIQEVLSEDETNDFIAKIWRELLRLEVEIQKQDS